MHLRILKYIYDPHPNIIIEVFDSFIYDNTITVYLKQ